MFKWVKAQGKWQGFTYPGDIMIGKPGGTGGAGGSLLLPDDPSLAEVDLPHPGAPYSEQYILQSSPTRKLVLTSEG